MQLQEAILSRRSVRKYTDQPVEKNLIEHLLQNACQAPSAMNLQPWSFAVLEDQALLDDYSTVIKASLLERMEKETSPLSKYRNLMLNPSYHIFYHAPALIIIYGKSGCTTFREDCALAAQNLMLTAADRGLGTCWIGFSVAHFNDPAIKSRLQIPSDDCAVAPIVVGYPKTNHIPIPKKEPRILYWK